MITGHIIPASDVYQIVNAFTYSGSYDLLISGSVAVGQGNVQSDAKFYIKQNLRVDGGITGSVTGSFKGDGTNITGIVSASYALTASYAMNGGNGGGDLTSLNDFTSSYYTDSASFSSRLNSLTPYKISTGSASLTTFTNGNLIAVSGSKDGGIHFIVSGSGSYTGTVNAASFYQNSLRVLKENIAPFSASAIELINTLDIVSFNYKKNTHLLNVGIIADDSHEYFSTKDHNVMHTGNCIGLLLKAVQELYKDNCELRRRMEKGKQ